jgi:vitamin B12 transporter
MTKSRHQILFILLSVLAAGEGCFCEEAPIYDKIVVTSRKDLLNFPFQEGLYSEQEFISSDLEQVSLNSLADIFNGAAGLDMRTRGTNGIQGDFSLRGSTFEQVGLFLDGLPMNDPQTGHHNLDIPLTRFDLEGVEVVKEGVALPFSGHSLAGEVLMRTKKPLLRKLSVENSFGEHALFGNALSLSLPSQVLSGRVSFEHKVAKAAVPNTDFDYRTGTVYLMRDGPGLFWDALGGYQEKDFGADSFYSNLYSE